MIITFNKTEKINLETLAKYHFSAEMIWEVRKEREQSPKAEAEAEYNFEIAFHFDNSNSEEENTKDASETYDALFELLEHFGISDHFGNLMYIIINHVKREGAVLEDQKVMVEWARPELTALIKLLKIKESGNSPDIRIQFTHKNLPNRKFPEYTTIENLAIVDQVIGASITSLFENIKKESAAMSPDLSFVLERIEIPTCENISGILESLSTLSQKRFDRLLLYTITTELTRYLSDETSMERSLVITNDHTRVIYGLFLFFGLIKEGDEIDHRIDLDRSGYIRSILNNDSDIPLSKSSINEEASARLDIQIARARIRKDAKDQLAKERSQYPE